MKKSLLILAATVGLGIAAPASAAQFMFDFSGQNQFGSNTISGNGVFTTSDTATLVAGETALAITSISGFVNGSAIVAPTGFYGNYFTTGPSFLDGTGLRFFTAANTDVRFFNQSSNGLYRVNTFSPGGSAFVEATSTPVMSAVPEPATWAMMIVGFGLAGAAIRSRPRLAVTVRA